MLATLTNPGDFAVISQDKPFHYVTKLTSWCDDISGTGVLKKEFRWGTSNRVRASWIDLTNQRLQEIVLNPANDLFVDFRITLVSGGVSIINSIEVNCERTADAKDPYLGFTPVMFVSERGNISNLTKIENFTFKPYQVNPAVVLYKELASTINKMFGHDVLYARAVPMAIGKDVTLHEWTLYDVDDPKCVKVLVPNNEFPDNKILFNPMGLDFEMPFEVHIVKDYFEQMFGVGTGPQRRDIVYFPLTNRIYEIESSYLFKDIMQKEVYWKVALKKYAPKANRYEPQDLREQLDSISHDSIERFGEEVELEAVKTTDPQQYDPKIGSRYYDPTRLNINDDLFISETRFLNYSLVLSESQYDMRSIFNITADQQATAVEYRADVNFPTTDERSLSMWFKELTPTVPVVKDNVRSFLLLGGAGPTTTPVTFVISQNRNYTNGTLLRITRFNGISLYGEVANVNSIPTGYVITINVKNEIITYLNTYYSNWASTSTNSGYVCEKGVEQVLFNGWNSDANTGWKLSVFASRYIVFTDSSGEYISILNQNLVDDYWYGIFVNISNFYRQISVDLWARKWNDQTPDPNLTTELENIYSNTFNNITPIDRSTDQKYKLIASNLSLTNLRLFDKIETEQTKQVIILNQTIVQDAQFAIIIDNAIQRLRLPWIGQTK
jgi:hypothetical protein